MAWRPDKRWAYREGRVATRNKLASVRNINAMSHTENILRPANPVRSPFGDGWSATRLAVRELLSVSAPSLIGLYEAAVRMLHDETFPSRKHLIAHCVREIANSLPSFFDGAMSGRADYQGLVRAIIEPWTASGLPIGEEAAPMPVSGTSAGGAPPTITVPLPIVQKIGKLLEVHTEVHGRRQHNAAVLFRALSPDPDGDTHHLRPTIKLWLDTCDRFQERVHHNRQSEYQNSETLETRFISDFEQFEGLLHSMIEHFLNIAKSLDEELDNANS